MSDYSQAAEGRCLGCGGRVRPGEDRCQACAGKPASTEDTWTAKPGVKGLPETLERGERWPLCPCGGRCRLICCFGGDSYWKCESCGHRHDERPLVTQANDYRACEGVLRAILRKDKP